MTTLLRPISLLFGLLGIFTTFALLSVMTGFASGSKLYRDEPDLNERTKYRTECWLEHSVFLERICAPEDNVSFTPLGIPTPIPGVFKLFSYFDDDKFTSPARCGERRAEFIWP